MAWKFRCAGAARDTALHATGTGIRCCVPNQEQSMIQRIDAGPRMSEASIHQGVVYLAGQVPETADADFFSQ